MRRGAAAAVLLDVAAVVLFVVVGRRSHDEGGNLVVEAVEVAAPLLIALGVAWLVLRAWRAPARWGTALGVWLITVTLGLLLRRAVFDRGTAASFVVVACVVLGVLLLGWRLVARRVRTCW